jgi:RNA polymerase sigma factor (sigma-70 family)
MAINKLFQQAHTGNRQAESDLFEQLAARFGLFARRRISRLEDSQEVVQEAMMAVARKWKSLEEEANFAAWAHRVLEVEILRYYRKSYFQEGKLNELRGESLSFETWTPDPVFQGRLLKCLGQVIERNSRYARVLNLHYQGYTADEICERMSVSKNNYYVILSRARTMLEGLLNEETES